MVERFASDDQLPPQLLREMAERQNPEIEDVEVEEEEEERFFDAQNFTWHSTDSWHGQKETFLPESVGPTREFSTPYEAFRAYWDDTIISYIVTETNLHAQSIQREKFRREWYPTNASEIFILLVFWISLGIVRLPTIKSCFSNMTLLKTEVFRRLFTESRYWNLNAAFHLANGPLPPDDPIHPVRPIVDHINQKFKEMYNLAQDISIDESLTLWKGPLGFKQYIKTKAARFGIKTFQLCESSTGYLWSFFVYVGKATTSSPLASSVSTVLNLIRPVLNRGHVLFMDNFFNSPSLARYLKRNGTDCVGTLRSNRKHVPLALRKCPLVEGEYIARHSGDVLLIALHDRKRITCVSTYHNLSQIEKPERPGRRATHRLQLIDDYNHCMGGVDRLDQMLEPYLIERKQCLKWSKKLFKRLVNISIQNARILVEKSTNTKIDSLAFRLALVSEIMERHLPNVPRHHSIGQPRRAHLPEARLTERHFIRHIPVTNEMQENVVHKSNLGRRRCALCYKQGRKTKTTVYECPDCEVPLCIEPCFKTWHTVE